MAVGCDPVVNAKEEVDRSTIEMIPAQEKLVEAVYGYSTAVGLFNSVVCLFFLVAANMISRRFSETSLW